MKAEDALRQAQSLVELVIKELDISSEPCECCSMRTHNNWGHFKSFQQLSSVQGKLLKIANHPDVQNLNVPNVPSLVWNPVDKALPNEGEFVLVWSDTGSFAEQALYDHNVEEWISSVDEEELYNVTHWAKFTGPHYALDAVTSNDLPESID